MAHPSSALRGGGAKCGPQRGDRALRRLAAVALFCLLARPGDGDPAAQDPASEAEARYQQFEQAVLNADCLSIRMKAHVGGRSVAGSLPLDHSYSVALRLKRTVGTRVELLVRHTEKEYEHRLSYVVTGKARSWDLLTGKEEPIDSRMRRPGDDESCRLVIARLGFMSLVFPMPDYTGPRELRDVLRPRGFEVLPPRLDRPLESRRMRFALLFNDAPFCRESLAFGPVSCLPIERELVWETDTEFCITETYEEFSTAPFADDLLLVETPELTGSGSKKAEAPAPGGRGDARGRR